MTSPPLCSEQNPSQSIGSSSLGYMMQARWTFSWTRRRLRLERLAFALQKKVLLR